MVTYSLIIELSPISTIVFSLLYLRSCGFSPIIAPEKISTLFNDEIFLCPIDYPYLYMQPSKTNILVGNSNHWRRIDQTLCTFLTSSHMVNKYFKIYIKF